MTRSEIVAELKHIRLTREGLVQAYKRKKSWKQSEIALSIAGVNRTIEALDLAIRFIEEPAPVALDENIGSI